jgi:hypothetical protein
MATSSIERELNVRINDESCRISPWEVKSEKRKVKYRRVLQAQKWMQARWNLLRKVSGRVDLYVSKIGLNSVLLHV